MLLIFVLAASALVPGLIGVLVGAYSGRDVLRNVIITATVPLLAFASYLVWLYVWERGCPGCRAGTEDTRYTTLVLTVMFYGAWLIEVLGALALGSVAGWLLRDRTDELTADR